ncbi:MAG: hypothetical protein H6Q73_3876 [Firmicutes bacterium]|nr:hypothetical protein [Bacillota bacterium]
MEKGALEAGGRKNDHKLRSVCKADLISLANEEENRKSEVLIDSLLKGEVTTSLLLAKWLGKGLWVKR